MLCSAPQHAWRLSWGEEISFVQSCVFFRFGCGGRRSSFPLSRAGHCLDSCQEKHFMLTGCRTARWCRFARLGSFLLITPLHNAAFYLRVGFLCPFVFCCCEDNIIQYNAGTHTRRNTPGVGNMTIDKRYVSPSKTSVPLMDTFFKRIRMVYIYIYKLPTYFFPISV